MLGIKITQMKLASLLGEGSVADGYAALATLAANWIRDQGYDPATHGMHYGRVLQACEPGTVPPPGSAFDVRTPGCNNGLDPGAVHAARVLTAEASQALRVYYESNPTPEARAWGDEAYGSIWGNPLYTTGGVYTDSEYVRDENSNGSLGAYKWTGFFFGMGMSHQWPAVRLGGPAELLARKVNLDVTQGLAAKIRIAVSAPSGKVSMFACGQASFCEVTVDDRQGAHLYQVQYLSADGKIVSTSKTQLIRRSDRAVATGIPRGRGYLPGKGQFNMKWPVLGTIMALALLSALRFGVGGGWQANRSPAAILPVVHAGFRRAAKAAGFSGAAAKSPPAPSSGQGANDRN